MKLACNYSAALMELISRGEADPDYIKAGAFGPSERALPAMRNARPVLLHGLGAHERSGMPGFEGYDFARANRLLALCGSPHLAIHLSVKEGDFTPGASAEEVRARMAACVGCFQSNLRVPLLLENTSDTPEERAVYHLIPFVEPDLIGDMIRRTGAPLLLDVTHAKVTAQYRGWNLRDYLKELPLDCVREVHVTGSGLDEDGFPRDEHGPMAEEDYAALDWTLAHTRPEIVTLEYGAPEGTGGPPAEIGALREQLLRLRSMISCRQS